MKAYLQLTAAQLRIFGRNRQVLFWSLLFPIFFMIMLGSFSGGGGTGSLSGYIIDEDRSAESQAFLDTLHKQNVIELEAATDREQALEPLRKGDKELVVVIPAGYGQSLTQEAAAAGTPGSILLYYDETQSVKAQIAITAMSQIVDGISKQIVQYKPALTLKTEGIQALNLQYIDFLVPGIVAMMIMSNNLNGVAGQIAAWRERGILRRMQSTPLNASSFIAAQITARLLLNGIQAVIVLLIGNLVFGTKVNGSWPLLLMFVIVGTLAFMAIGFIIAGVAKNPESAGPIAGFISFPMMFLGGVFFPISNMPDWLQPIVKLLPISHLSTALRQVMNVGAGLTQLWGEALLLCGWLVVAFIVATFTFKWE